MARVFQRGYTATAVKAKRPPRRAPKPARPSSAPGRAALKRARTRLRESEEKFSKLFHAGPAKLAIGTFEGTLVEVNRAYADFFGFKPEEMVGKSIADLGIISREEMIRLLKLGRAPGAAMRDVEVLMRARDGRRLNVLMSADIIVLGGEPRRFATLVDISDRKRAEAQRRKLEERLSQVQRMEAIGRLAGGVAHDFNNILTAMNGYAKFVHEDLPTGDRRRDDMKELLGLVDRAARLTNQLLAFSRKQILVPQVLDLNAIVEGISKMLKRLIGENIVLRVSPHETPCFVEADPGQLEQVLLNLAVNARDAMPGGGNLTFETSIETPGEAFWERHPGIRRGPLVCLRARDTGHGMTEDVKARVFEPFFTTKEAGRGTGLGLAMVYGIVKQSGGGIEVESAPGRGAAFRVYLPRVDASRSRRSTAEAVSESASALGGSETILLVEDEDAVRRVAERALAAGGYTVLCASDAESALAALETHSRPVDALITDVVMPGLDGRTLARAIAERGLARKTLFISGHTEDSIVRRGVLEEGLAFLNKPFSSEALLRKVREVLDGPAHLARA